MHINISRCKKKYSSIYNKIKLANGLQTVMTENYIAIFHVSSLIYILCNGLTIPIID